MTGSKGGLPGLAVRRPVTMLMLFLSLMVVGGVAWHGIPLKLLPEGVDPPFLYVWLSYPNASPVENMEQICMPVEELLWTVKNVKRIRSRSRDNGSGILIEFTQAVDMDAAYLAVRDRLERVRPDLPDDLRYIYLWRYSEEDEPILYFTVSITGNYKDPYRLVTEEVVKKLERIDGIAKVEVRGGNEKMIRIEFILDRLKAHNVDIAGLMRELRQADFAVAGGRVDEGDHELLVRANGRISSLEELADLPIKGASLRLGDVADISYSEPRVSWVERVGGREAIEIAVYKTSDANTIDLSHQLIKEVDRIAELPHMGGMKFDILFDQGEYIIQSLENLQEAGIWGALFAVIVLFLFLRRLRMTLFITLAIPLSLLTTIICLYFMGWSLNVITLSGLMICVGLVVDNAIVVVESIHTTRQQGLTHQQAAIAGAHEVALAITLATLTTMVVFLPLMLMSGDRMLAFFLKRVGMPVVFALSASLMAALLFIPLAVHRFAISGRSQEPALIKRGAYKIERLVRWVLNHRADTFLIMTLLMASIAIPMQKVVSTDQEESNINDLRFALRFPMYYSMEAVDSTMSYYEAQLYDRSEQYNIKTVVTGFRRGFGRIHVFMNPEKERLWFLQGIRRIAHRLGLLKSSQMNRREMVKDLKEWLKPPPDVNMYTSWQTGQRDENSVRVRIYGEDTRKLLDIADEVKRRLTTISGILSVDVDLESSVDEVQIRFDRDKTSRYSVDPFQTSTGLLSLMRGVRLPEIRMDGYEINAVAELREEDRTTLAQVMNLPVNGGRGEVIRMDDVADIGYGRGLGQITRENRRTRLSIKITTTEDDLHKLSKSIDASLAGLVLPPGYEWNKGERFASIEEAGRERNQVWLLALMFVFLVMGALFESFLLPWCVIITIPFSFFGVWWFLWITGTQFGLMAGIGVIILIGVVVNNAIVLVDRVNMLRESGVKRNEALAVASRQRFRPIAMTALTTIMGLAPMAVGDASLVGIPYAPMGRAIIGGMLTATISTPIIVPLAYSLIDDFRLWMKRYFISYRSKRHTAGSNHEG